jgi:hypothetical protein
MKFLSLSVAAIALTLGACERHSWEDVKDEDGKVLEKGTKNLYKPHGGEEGDDHDAHGDKAHDKDPAKDGDQKDAAAHDPDGDGKPAHD